MGKIELVIFSFLFFFLIVLTFQIQKTNRLFIEKGYYQQQKIGTYGYLWTKGE